MLVAVAATLALGGCATSPVTRAATSAVSDSLVRSDGRPVGLWLGPGPVGLPPGETAGYMDRQEAGLRTEMEGTGVSVARIGERILLTLPGNVTFNTNNADIRSDFFPVLNSLARVLDRYDQTLIEVTGHTDNTGSDKINQPLSERRADSVAMYLRSQRIDNGRLSAHGRGSRYPVASNDTATGREQNRRMEILVSPVVAAPAGADRPGGEPTETDAEGGLTAGGAGDSP